MTNLDKIKELRSRTFVGLDKCKLALEATNGNLDEAVVYLQKQGLTDSAKKADRTTGEGVINSYVHMGRIGVLLEVGCETDFASRSDLFKTFAELVSMQIAAMNPQYLSKETVPTNVINEQKAIFMEQLKDKTSNKPEHVVEKMLEGKLNKWLSDVSLLEQQFVEDPKKTVEQLRVELVSKLGENVVVKRFVRWELTR